MAAEDGSKSGVPTSMIVRIAASLLPLPGLAVMLGVDFASALIGCLFGCIVFAFLVRRLRRGSRFPGKAVLLSVMAQVSALMLLGAFMGHGFGLLANSMGIRAVKYLFYGSSSGSIETMSVILPCANEGIYAVNTARSIGELTPKNVLVEIIVVDDGSTPPLEEFFRENAPDVLQKYPIKFIRHETFTGLINAKKQGGDRATGDVLTFLDCHVLPRDYGYSKSWADGIMARIADNYKRVVVPSITDLDADKWEEIGKPKGVAKCYLSLDVDFRWFDSDDDYVPIMSGGLLAMSRQWWFETGGYDAEMVGWGGENIDQSLRIWLCGGEIVQATDSHVAHMWRTNAKPQTKAKYTVPEGAVNTNRYRVALAWMDDYLEKVNEYPIFSKYTRPNPPALPDVSSILAVKHGLQCQPFQWFIDRFSNIYMDGGVLPEKVFRVRDSRNNLCLARRNTGVRQEHDVVAATCSNDDPMQLWHNGNRNATSNSCCSGLRSFDSMYCLAGGAGGKTRGNECNIFGGVHDQYVQMRADGVVFFEKFNTCLQVSVDESSLVAQTQCDAKNVLKNFQLRAAGPKKIIVEKDTGKCLSAIDDSVGLVLCDAHDPQQEFALKDVPDQPGFFQIITAQNTCLDSGDGKQPVLAYPCYDFATSNKKQFWTFAESTLIKNSFHPACLAVPDQRVKEEEGQIALNVTGCVVWDGVVKPEQLFATQKLNHVSVGVLVKSAGFCLSADGTDKVALVECPADPASVLPSSPLLWSLEKQSRMRNISTNKCLDGNDHKTPILYPCYDSENDNQEWSDPGQVGGLIKNSRASMCLDYRPLPERKTTVSSICKSASGNKWEVYDPREAKEYSIYKRAHERVAMVAN